MFGLNRIREGALSAARTPTAPPVPVVSTVIVPPMDAAPIDITDLGSGISELAPIRVKHSEHDGPPRLGRPFTA